MTIVEFLLARLAEDAAVLQERARLSRQTRVMAVTWEGRRVATSELVSRYDSHNGGYRRHFTPDRAQREVEAKRRIVAEHALNGWICGTCDNGEVSQVFPCPTLRLLAAVYAGHPDYDPEWRP